MSNLPVVSKITDIKVPSKNDPLVTVFIEKYIASNEFKKLSKSTRDSYLNEYKLIINYIPNYIREHTDIFWGDMTVDEFNSKSEWDSAFAPTHIGHVVNTLLFRIMSDLKRSDASMFKMCAAIKSAVGYYITKLGMDAKLFKEHIIKIKQPKSDGLDPWPLDDIKKVIDSHDIFLDACLYAKEVGNTLAFMRSNENRIACVVVATLFFTGQRISDACSWYQKNIIDGDAIVFKQSKTSKEMTIPIHPVLKQMFDAGFELSKREGRQDWSNKNLLTGSMGKLSRHKAWNMVELMKKEAGIKNKCGLHGLRKSTAIEMINAGATVEYVKAITGHRSAGMVEHYAKKKNQAMIAKRAIAFLPSL